MNGDAASSLAQIFQPTVGVSFGLPQGGAGYGGYQQNPLGTGGAVNPYYTTDKRYSNGISLGGVDVNPLISFQATTNENGSVVAKPLLNLHVTPNGCGLFGCEEDPYRQTNQGYDNQYYDNVQFSTRRQQVRFQDGFRPSKPYQHETNARPRPRPTSRPNIRPEILEALRQANQVKRQTSPFRFQDQKETIVKHEHHHYHHHNHEDRNSGSNFDKFKVDTFNRNNFDDDSYGIGFGFGDGPSFRNANADVGQEGNNDVKKRRVNFDASEPDKDEVKVKKSGFSFPKARSLSRKKRQEVSEEQVESVGKKSSKL